MAGVSTSATYYQDVRVPVSNRVGEEDGGWKLVTNQLNHERVALVSAQPIFLALNQVREWAQNTKDAHGNRLVDSEWVQLNLARVHAKAEYLKLINWELASAHSGTLTGRRLRGQGFRHRTGDRGLPAADGDPRAVGHAAPGLPGALLRGRVERMHRAALVLTFGGGTNEIQRDIIGMVALGCPG